MSVVIPYKNPKALVGYYLGLFSIMPVLGMILGPVALVLGVMGLRDRARNPEIHGMAHAIVALVVGGIGTLMNLGIVTLIIIGITNS